VKCIWVPVDYHQKSIKYSENNDVHQHRKAAKQERENFTVTTNCMDIDKGNGRGEEGEGGCVYKVCQSHLTQFNDDFTEQLNEQLM